VQGRGAVGGFSDHPVTRLLQNGAGTSPKTVIVIDDQDGRHRAHRPTPIAQPPQGKP
jgi:hypothetical protein